MRSLLVLVLTEDPQVWEFIHEALWEDGHVVDRARDERDALDLLALREYDVVFTETEEVRAAALAAWLRRPSRSRAARPRQVLVVTAAPGGDTAWEISPRRRLPVLRAPFTEQDVRDIVVGRPSDHGRTAARS